MLILLGFCYKTSKSLSPLGHVLSGYIFGGGKLVSIFLVGLKSTRTTPPRPMTPPHFYRLGGGKVPTNSKHTIILKICPTTPPNSPNPILLSSKQQPPLKIDFKANLKNLHYYTTSRYNLKMNEKYKKFIDWYVTPQESRRPQTLPEWGRDNDCSPSDITDFYAYQTFPEDVSDAAVRWGYSKIPELLHATYKQFLLNKSPQLLMAYKELLRINKKEPGQTTNVNILQVTDDKYARIIERESRRFGAREITALVAGSEE